MSYTNLDWLGDLTREGRPFNRDAYNELLMWLREDGKAIVSIKDMDALTDMVAGLPFEDDALNLAVDHWAKDRADWVP